MYFTYDSRIVHKYACKKIYALVQNFWASDCSLYLTDLSANLVLILLSFPLLEKNLSKKVRTKDWRKENRTWWKSCLRWAFWRSTVPIQCWKWPGRWSQLSPVWDHFLSRGLSHTELACRKRGRPEPRNRNIPTHIIVHNVWHQKMNSYITQSQCKSWLLWGTHLKSIDKNSYKGCPLLIFSLVIKTCKK